MTCGLRDYGIEGQVWGGEEGCGHEWEIKTIQAATQKGGNWQQAENGPGLASGKCQTRFKGDTKEAGKQEMAEIETGFCRLCGAWRGSLGLEPTIEMFVGHMVEVFREVRRVLRKDGVLFLNLGSSYAGSGMQSSDPNSLIRDSLTNGYPKVKFKPKDLIMVPAMVALALQQDGWFLRSDIIWAKKNPMPESCTDRPTTAHEHIFLLTKSAHYFWDQEAVREKATRDWANTGGSILNDTDWHKGAHGQDRKRYKPASDTTSRNLRTVWDIATHPFTGWFETVRQVHVSSDAVSCGMKHKVSPDCPVHGCLCQQDSIRPGGEREGDGQPRNGRNGVHPSQEQLSGCESTDLPHGEDSWEHNWDSPVPMYFPFAKDRSIGSHKKDRASETSAPCISSGETPSRIDGKQGAPLMAGSAGRTSGSNTSPGGLGDRPLAQTLCRTVDKSSLPIPPECLCSFYQEVTEKSSHFATFPPELVRRCVAAGTSERGCCPSCGAPWKRKIIKGEITSKGGSEKGMRPSGNPHTDFKGGAMNCGEFVAREHITTGWTPTCACKTYEDELPRMTQSEYDEWFKESSVDGVRIGPFLPVPCTVLDPFGGAMTTSLVSAKMGRDSVSIELNPDYITMGIKRIKGELGMLVDIVPTP